MCVGGCLSRSLCVGGCLSRSFSPHVLINSPHFHLIIPLMCQMWGKLNYNVAAYFKPKLQHLIVSEKKTIIPQSK